MKNNYQKHVTAVCIAVALVLCVSGTAMSFGHYTIHSASFVSNKLGFDRSSFRFSGSIFSIKEK